MRSRAEKCAYCAAFIVLGLIFSYVEALLPVNLLIPIPGFKLGLANLAVMIAYFTLGYNYAFCIGICRIVLSSLLFGTVTSLWFSLAGGLLSLLALLVYKLFLSKMSGVIGLSVMCAAMHNIGQCMVCAALFGHYVLTSYLPFLLLVSLITGSANGYITYKITNLKFFKQRQP